MVVSCSIQPFVLIHPLERRNAHARQRRAGQSRGVTAVSQKLKAGTEDSKNIDYVPCTCALKEENLISDSNATDPADGSSYLNCSYCPLLHTDPAVKTRPSSPSPYCIAEFFQTGSGTLLGCVTHTQQSALCQQFAAWLPEDDDDADPDVLLFIFGRLDKVYKKNCNCFKHVSCGTM